ncbi:MAG: YibE/F family protein [Acidimicrobiaceae bacterium]|nr:YibE/F family protein [Acidimicrobiaceae bacterium]MXZ64512.1 YibE/F family protein [Acidimicrobiaceae bacterium]MYF33781.1 YibE/F family protein [Acidimicrobiaceae bacterium]MYG78474.1 YibE/F family protein [Acidimicrobiaceae bacterium]MYJ85209.1 YibE/F family protein [Acidimicrobiaceae bacterium]
MDGGHNRAMRGHSHFWGPEWGPRAMLEAWRSDRALQAVLAFVGLAILAAAVGMALLWPTGAGRDAARQRADDIGIVYERLAATVVEVSDRACSYSAPDDPQACRFIVVRVDEGPDGGAQVALPEFSLEYDRTAIRVSPADKVVLGYEASNDYYFFVDRDRRTPLLWLAILFAGVVVALGRWRGGLALAGMAATLVVLIAFAAPSVLDGNDPVLVAVVAAAVIAFVSLYLTHGLNVHTTVALAGTLASLGLTLGLSWIFFGLADFTGLATEEGLTLPLIAADIDLASLLLGGAIIGALGALDDVTVTQVATVAELRYRSPSLSVRQLIASGIRVGREHIAATVNTLLLAYVGAGLPLLLLFAVSDQSLAMAANSELIAVEIVRTLCGSMGLVAAVPVTTVLAAVVAAGSGPTPPGEPAGDTHDEPDAAPADDSSEREVTEPGPAPRWEDFAPDQDQTRW